MNRLGFVLLVFVALSFRSGHTGSVGSLPAAPEVSLETVAGSKLSLTHFRGKVVLLHFWATWCPTCVLEMKDIQKLEDKLGDKGFEVIGISASNKKDTLVFLSENKITFQNSVDRFGTVTNDYGVTAFPTHILIDRKGKILEKWIGKQDWSGSEREKKLLDYLR